MKSTILLLFLSTLISFGQIQTTEHGFLISAKEQKWMWVTFPDTNNPIPLTASVTTTVQPVITKIGYKWQIKFGVTSEGQAMTTIDYQISTNLERQKAISKQISKIELEYFVKTGEHINIYRQRSLGDENYVPPPEVQQIKDLQVEMGKLAKENTYLEAKKELEQK